MSLNQSLISDFSEYYRWSQRTKIKYKLHYGWCTGRRFTAATRHNTSNKVDGIDTALATASVGLAASGIGLLSTIIAVPVAIGIRAGVVLCSLLGAGGNV